MRALSRSTSASARCGARIGNSRRATGIRSAVALAASSLRDHAGGGGVGENAVAGASRGFRIAIRPARLRRLRQGNEERGLGQRQPARLLAEVGERRGPDAFEVAAEGCEPQIEPQDLILREAALQLQRAQRLPDLAGRVALMLALHQAGDLHGERRAAGDDAPVADELPARAPDRPGIDAMMHPEALVLEGDQHGEVARVDVFDVDRQAPAAVGRRVGAQQPVVAIEHRHRNGLGAGKRQGRHALPDDARSCWRQST